MSYAQAIAIFAGNLTDEQAACDGLLNPERMRHYRANCRLNRISALQATFSTVNSLLGEDFFRAMAREYVDANPATSANLHEMGADLSDFIAQFAPAAEFPYLPDVAKLDWARWQAYLAPDTEALQLSDLASLAESDFAAYRLKPHPTMQLVQSAHWPIADILAMHAGGEVADLGAGGQQLLISRLQWQAISMGQWAFFKALQSDCTVSNALDQALNIDERTDINQALMCLFSQGLLSGVSHPPAI